MTPQDFCKQVGEENPDILSLPDCDDAIMGKVERCGFPPVLLYDEERVILCLMRANNWDIATATEWFDFNIKGAYVGNGTPMFFTPIDTSDVPAKLGIFQDPGTTSPLEFDTGWSLVSFVSRDIDSRDIEEYYYDYENGEYVPNAELEEKIRTGKAFELSYFSHSSSFWFRKGTKPCCQWDTLGRAGILFLPSGIEWKDEEIPQMVDSFLEEYNNWCNGYCYGYVIESANGDCIDSCGGHIGEKWIVESLKEEHPELFDDDGNVKKGIEVEDQFGILPVT